MNIVSHHFERNGHQLRIQEIDEEPWFVGRDVCAALGLSNPYSSLALLQADDLHIVEVADSAGRLQQTKVISESGFYTLLMRSRRPEAQEFQRWVTKEVLPAIRKTGSYAQPGRVAEPQAEVAALQAENIALKDELIVLQRDKIAALQQQIAPPRKRGPALSQDEQDEIRSLHAKGLTPTQIGRRIGRPSGTVSSWLRRQRGSA